MQADLHPPYHDIEVELTDGSVVIMRSTYGELGSRLKLYADPSSHPAWVGGQNRLHTLDGRVSKFKRKFEDFGY
jgi:large subunit ribosomal protein L31